MGSVIEYANETLLEINKASAILSKRLHMQDYSYKAHQISCMNTLLLDAAKTIGMLINELNNNEHGYNISSNITRKFDLLENRILKLERLNVMSDKVIRALRDKFD